MVAEQGQIVNGLVNRRATLGRLYSHPQDRMARSADQPQAGVSFGQGEMTFQPTDVLATGVDTADDTP